MKKKKDALFLCQFFYPEYISSAQLPYDAVRAIADAGHSVDVICGYPKEYNLNKKVLMQEKVGTISIRRLKYIQFKRSSFIGRIINYLSFTTAVALHFFRMERYHTIFVYSNPPILPIVAAMAKRLFKCSLVFVSFDVYPEIAVKSGSIAEGSFFYKLMVLANKFIYKNTDKVIAISGEMKSYILHNRHVSNPDQIEVVPNWYQDDQGVNGSNLVMHPQLKEIRDKNRLIVSYFGNMGICQDMDTILDAIHLLKGEPEIHFLFAGHGNKLAHIRTVITEEKLHNVTIFDYLHGQDYVDALRVSDCFLASLIDGLAGLCVPSKIYSYLSASKPVIAIMEEDYDIVQDIIKYEAGYCIHQGDAHKLKETIINLKDRDDYIFVKGRNGRSVYEQKYTRDTCTSQYIRILDELLLLRGAR